MKMSIIRNLGAQTLLICFMCAASKTTEAEPEDYFVASDSTYDPRYEIKHELLLNEFQIRTSASENAESIIYQTRLALVTLLVGFLVLLFERSRRANRRNNNEKQTISKGLLIGLIVFLLCMYWSDCYIKDLQERVEIRATKVIQILNSIPSMQQSEIDTLQVYPSLRHNDFVHKVCILFKPNFAQFLAYTPLAFMIVLLLWNYRGRNKSLKLD